MPPHNTIRQPLSSVGGPVALQVLKQVLSITDGISVIQERSAQDEAVIRLAATGNTWSRAARRKKLKVPSNGLSQEITISLAALVCQITLSYGQLEFNWIRGRDRTLFESFCSHVSRKVASNLVS
jgi:hypothetical protein